VKRETLIGSSRRILLEAGGEREACACADKAIRMLKLRTLKLINNVNVTLPMQYPFFFITFLGNVGS
jgi:hypothetical protein